MRDGFVVWSLAVLLAVAVCLPVAAAPGAAGRVTCTGVVIRLPGTIAFQGSHGPVLRAVETNLPADRYTVRYDAASRVLRIAPWRPGWRLQVDLAGSPQEKILFQVYLATMAKPIPLRIAAAGGHGAGEGSACVACTHVDALAAGDGQSLIDALSQRLPLRERGYWMRWTLDLASQAAWAARQRRLHDQVQDLLATGGARSLPRWQTTRAAYGDPARREAEHTLAAWEKELWRAYLAQYGETMDVRDPAQRDLRITQAVRMSMALRMSPQYMAPGARDAARALLDDPMFISTTIMGITAYFALVAVPEPILTKASVVLTTIALVSLAGFAAAELVTLARAWMRLRDESAAARSLGELERAAMHFGHSIGGSGLRILAVLATLVVGQTLPGAPPSGAAAGPVVLAVTTRGGTLATLTAAEMIEIGWVVQVLKTGAVILMATSAAGGGPGPDMSPGLAGAGGSGATAAGPGGGGGASGGGKGTGPGAGGAVSRGKAARPPSGAAPSPARSVLEIPPAEIWQMPPLERGRVIEDVLAATEYKGWYRVGAEDGGTLPVVDFQKGRKVVSLKTVDPQSRGAVYRMKEHIKELSAWVSLDGTKPNLILDIRVPAGSKWSRLERELIKYVIDLETKVKIQIKEF